MFSLYADEAFEEWKDERGKPHKFTFVCGYVASVAQWERFEIDWRCCLAKYDITAFHMKTFSQSVGEFAKWKDRKWEQTRIEFMAEAAAIVREYVRHGFISMLSDSVFEAVNQRYRLREACGNPYGVTGRVCADMMRSWHLHTHGDVRDLEYVFEKRNKGKGTLSRAMTGLFPALPDPIFKPGKDEKPSPKCPDGIRGVVQLQAADYLAYEIRKIFADQIKTRTERAIRKSFTAITPIYTAKELLTEKALECFCERCKIKERK
jgi:hypothetical protein